MIPEKQNVTSEMLSHYSSDCGKRECKIFARSREIDFKMREPYTRAVLVQERRESFSCEFWEDNLCKGYIIYPDKHLSFVEKAAENWVTFVMTLQTVKKYSTIV